MRYFWTEGIPKVRKMFVFFTQTKCFLFSPLFATDSDRPPYGESDIPNGNRNVH